MTVYATFVNLENGLTAEEAEVVSIALPRLSRNPKLSEIVKRANEVLDSLDSDQIRSIEFGPSDEIRLYVGPELNTIRGDVLFHNDPNTVRAIANAFGI